MTVSILVVDDEPDVAELFRQRFRREVRQGHYVLHFADSGEAGAGASSARASTRADRDPVRHQHARHGRADVAARDQAALADLPVMMVTAYGDDERRRAASEYGAAEFITKPVDFDLLKQQLRPLSPPLQREPV